MQACIRERVAVVLHVCHSKHVVHAVVSVTGSFDVLVQIQRLTMENRNAMLMIISRFISQLGDKFFIPAVFWLAVSAEGGSTTRLGIISVVMAIPPLLSAFIGVFIDKLDKKS